MAKRVGSIWFELFTLLSDYMNEELYSIVDTELEVIRIVDFKTKPIDDDDDNSSYINENIVGYSYVKEDQSIYDETGTLIETLSKGSKFIYDDVDYFIPSNLEVVELGLQWNNTRIGDLGISLQIGGFSIDEKDDLSTLWNTPQIVIEMDEESNVDIAERDGNSSSTLKQLTFDFVMLVNESDDILKNKTGYTETHRIEEILNDIVYNFFNTKQCSRELPLMKWTHNLTQIYTQRPMVVSTYGNFIQYR